MSTNSAPFAAGSISLRCYPHLDLPAPEIVRELRAQAALAVEHGFDGVMTSEHHGGFAGYLPNPLQAAGFALDAMAGGWAAPCPLLLPLRPTALVIEETAWLAARYPGRVGLGVAAGALPIDFEIMDTTMDDLTARFANALELVTRVLGGGDAGALAGDPAIAHLRDHPIPVLERGRERDRGAARRVRSAPGSCSTRSPTPVRCRELVDAYRAAGGTPAVRAHPAGVDRRAARRADRAAGRHLPQLRARGRGRELGQRTSWSPRPIRRRSSAGSPTRPERRRRRAQSAGPGGRGHSRRRPFADRAPRNAGVYPRFATSLYRGATSD